MYPNVIVILLLLAGQPSALFGQVVQRAGAPPPLKVQEHHQHPSRQLGATNQQANQQSSRPVATGAGSHYYYTRTRDHPSHLRVAEEVKNNYVDEIKYESRINGTKYEYYKSYQTISYDELVYETIDKIFRHRLSPFYIHHYDHDHDRRRSSDPSRVSHEACARDLLYLVEKLPKRSLFRNPFAGLDDDVDHKDHRQGSDINSDHNRAQDEPLTPELMAFFDSYARPEAGLLRGNTYWVGSHDQCVTRHIFELFDSAPAAPTAPGRQEPPAGRQQQVVSFRGRYCVASLKAPVWDQMIENKKRQARDYFKSERQFREYSKLFRLQLGICLPDSCDSTAIERHVDEIRLLAKSTLEPRLAEYQLIDLYCLPDEASPLRQWSSSALGFLAFVAVWSVAVLVATLADVLGLFDSVDSGQHSDCEHVVTTSNIKPISQQAGGASKWCLFIRLFSLRANYRRLMKVCSLVEDEAKAKAAKKNKDADVEQRDEQSVVAQSSQTRAIARPAAEASDTAAANGNTIQVDLRFLNAFKAIIMFWIINGHIMLLMIQTAKNILDSDALLNGLMHFLIGATFGVDLFFTMTGFLTAYLLFNSGHAFKMKLTTWLYLTFHRYWRLAPLYLLTFWFSRSVMQSLGSGPLWDYGTSSLTFRGLCNNESWWYPLTLTSNLHGLFEECMITSWYISCDMQFWLVSPVFIYLLAKSPSSGWLVTLATIVASSKVRYDTILNEKSARHDELVQPRADIFMRVSHDLPALYTHPHYRISAYLVGLLAGHYVYMIKSGKWSSVLAEDLAQRQQQQAAVAADDGADEKREKTTTTLKNKQADEKETDESVDDDKTATTTTPAKQDDGLPDSSDDGKPETTTTTTKSTTATNTGMTRAQRSRRIRTWLAYLGLLTFLIMASCSYLLANYFPSRYLKHSRPIAAVLYSIDHLVMSVGASLIIVAMCMGHWQRLTQFLSHPNWTRLSKINYALLLLQCEAIYYQIFRYEQVPMAGTRELINILFNLLVTLYPIAFVVTLVFEFPLANLERFALKSLVFGRSQ
jgi:peptidoglycan/LPS O-acetylase OafA/YrhL